MSKHFFFRSSPSKLDYTPVSAPELNFANISGDKLTVAQELLVPRNAARRTEEPGPGPGKGLVHTSSFRRAKVGEYDGVNRVVCSRFFSRDKVIKIFFCLAGSVIHRMSCLGPAIGPGAGAFSEVVRLSRTIHSIAPMAPILSPTCCVSLLSVYRIFNSLSQRKISRV